MANVIDTLIVKLGLDNSEFKGKIEDAKKQTDDLGDSVDDLSDSVKKAATFGTFFGNVIYKAMEMAISVAKRAISSYDDYIESLRLISRETNQSIEDYQKWAYAIEYAGGNVNAFTSTFEKLSKQVRQAPFTHNSTFLRGLSELGVNVHSANGQIKSMSDLLLGLAGRLSRMSEGKALLIGQRLGLDDDTIRLLHEGKNAVQEYLDKTKQDAVIQKQNLEIYERLRKIRVELSRGWTELSNKIGNYVLPIVIKISDAFSSFLKLLKENSRFILHTLWAIGIAFGVFEGIGTAVWLVVKALRALKYAMWGLGIGAFILIVDDLWTWIEGGDSILGRIIEKFDEWTISLGNLMVEADRNDDWLGLKEMDWSISGIIEKFKKLISILKFLKSPSEWFSDFNIDNLSGIVGMTIGAGDIQNVSNSTTRYDFPYAKFYMSANNPQEFMTMLPQQTVINAEGNP